MEVTQGETREDYNKRLHRQFLEGDLDSLNWLFHENKGLAAYFFKRYKFIADKRNDLDYEDIDSVCKLGLTIGITNWNPEKGSLARAVGWYIKREVRNLTWKEYSAKSKGYLGKLESLQKPLDSEDEDTDTLEEITECPKNFKSPDKEAFEDCVCDEFFYHLENRNNPPQEELDALKTYVYEGIPPDRFNDWRKIKELVTENKSTKQRKFWDKWLEENRLNFYPSIKYKEIKTKTNENADPTAEDAINLMFEREKLANEIEEIIENI